jgi:hypothetical protein
MRTIAIKIVAVALAGALGFSVPLGAAAATEGAGNDKPGVQFTWALLQRVPEGDYVRTKLVEDGAKLASGAGLRLVVERLTPCTVYVIHRGPRGEITRLFPPAGFDRDQGVAQRVSVPSDDDWLWLDAGTGTERFFVIAATEPIVRLDALLGLYETADAGARAALGDDLEREIVRLRREHQPLSKDAERPAIVGGAVRGFESWGKKPEAVTVATDGVFVKVLTIDHH